MKIKKRLISVLLAGAMILGLVGCGSGDEKKDTAANDGDSSSVSTDDGNDSSNDSGDGNTADDEGSNGATPLGKGRFLETEITLPDGIDKIYQLKKLADGSLEAIAQLDETKLCFMLKSKDMGETWKQIPLQGVDEEFYPQVAIAPDGGAIICAYAKDGETPIKKVSADGSVKDTVLKFDKKDKMLRQADYDSEGNLYVRDSDDEVYMADLKKQTFGDSLKTDGISIAYFGIAGTILTAVCSDGMLLFDTKTGEALAKEDTLSKVISNNRKLTSMDTDMGFPMVFTAGDDEKGIVYADSDGIFHFTCGGSVHEQLADGKLSSLGAASIYYSVVMADNEHIFVVADSQGKQRLLCYTYDENAAAQPQQEVAVYSLDESAALRSVIAGFQKNNPDIYINLEIGMSKDSGVTVEDALKTLSTDIMAGKGPDVLILDGMPVDSYIEKGILEDISDVVGEVDSSDGLFKNIVEGSKKDGKIYAMPTYFLPTFVEGDAEALEAGKNLSTFADYCEKLQQKDKKIPAIDFRGKKRLLKVLLDTCSSSLTKADGTLDETILTDYLKQAQRLYELTKDRDSKDFDDFDNDLLEGGYKVGSFSNSGLVSNSEQACFGTIAGASSFQVMYSVEQQLKNGYKYGILNQGQASSYIPYLMAGVTKKDDTTAAKNFVKALLGADNSTAENGFPVNRKLYDKSCEFIMSDESADYSIGFGTADSDTCYSIEYTKVPQSEVDALANVLGSLTTPCMTNRVIIDLIMEQGNKLLAGDQSLEDTTAAILQKVNLYLSE